MFVLVVIALLLAAFGSNNESSAEANKQINYVPPAVQKAQKAAKTDSSVARNAAPQEDAPAIAAEDLLSTIQKDDLQRERALIKVKDYILPSGKTIETFLDQKYSGYQTSWNADVLSANNYFVHFKASKIRQEPLVYSFSIDLDKNEINGLNNLGMDLLLKGE